MSIRSVTQIACVLAGVFLAATAVQAQSVWVSDQFEIMLRTGPSTNNAIERVLVSGTRLEVLEQDADTGYSRVRTAAGTEGWVLTRYLMGEPPAREQLETLTSQLTNANAQGSSMTAQLQAIRTEQQNATRQIRELQEERDRLKSELEEVTRVSANVLSIDSQNKNLREQLADAEIKVGILEEENNSLRAQEDRKWFIIGAMVLSIGIIVGLVLPRIKFRRRSRYDRL